MTETLPSTLDIITRTEIDTQVATAKRYPRNLAEFSSKTKQVALSSKDVAESCFYTLKRKEREGGTKLIQGPSIRLLEIAAAAYGNIRCGARIVSDQGRWVVAQGVAHDLENNCFVTTEVMRPIVTRDGRRYSDDMVSVTANAVCSIAKRNALLAVIPRQMVEAIMDECRKMATQSIKAEGKIAERWAAAVEWFGAKGVTAETLLNHLDISLPAEVTPEHIATLRGLKTAIEDGEATVGDIFQIPVATPLAGASGPETPLGKAVAKVRETREKQKQAQAEREPGAEEVGHGR